MFAQRLWRLTLLTAVIALNLLTERASSQESVLQKGRAVKTKGYSSVNGLKMYYEISGQGLPAVYIHPIASQCSLVGPLTTNRRWIAMDLQGHGRTADIDRPMTCEQHADDIAALLKQLQIDQADFFGDSFGGAVAMTVVIRHPALVRRVVVYGNTLAPFSKEIVNLVTSDSTLVRWEREEYQKVAPDPNHWSAFFSKVLKCGIDWKGLSIDELKAIRVPVLIACGDHDLVPIERCVELSRTIPTAQLAVLPDASHFTLFSEPHKLLPTVAEFLDGPVSKTPLSTFDTGYYPGLTR